MNNIQRADVTLLHVLWMAKLQFATDNNVNAKKWIAPSESVETIEQGKLKAATYETYLRQVANLELPPLQWEESRAA